MKSFEYGTAAAKDKKDHDARPRARRARLARRARKSPRRRVTHVDWTTRDSYRPATGRARRFRVEATGQEPTSGLEI
jgi:hypothetical protein